MNKSLAYPLHAGMDVPAKGRPMAERSAALSAVPSTLRIPLAARALGDALFPRVAVGDADAAAVLRAIGDDGTQWLGDRHSVYAVMARTLRFRELAVDFLDAHPAGQVVNLGCGLSNYFQWLDNGRNTWLDTDMRPSMELRRRLLPPDTERQRSAIIDLRRPQWWQDLNLPAQALGQPLFMLCEGVLMYLQPQQVRHVLHSFAAQAPAGSRLVIDILAGCAVGMAQWHASVGPTKAQFHWGIRSLQELTDCHPRLRLLATHSVAASHGWMGIAAERMWSYWSSTPLYGVVELGVE